MSSGVLSKLSVKRPSETASYGTAASASSRLIPFLSFDGKAQVIRDRLEVLHGGTGQAVSDKVGYEYPISLSLPLLHKGLDPFLYAALGFENPTVYDTGTSSGGSPAYTSSQNWFRHVFEMDHGLARKVWSADERDASSGSDPDPTYWTTSDQKVRDLTVEIDADDFGWSYVASMVRKLTISIRPTECKMDLDMIARARSTGAVSASSINVGRYIFTQASLRIGSTGATPTSSYAIQEFELTLENNLEFDRDTGSADYIYEPEVGNVRTVTGSLKLARYVTDDYETWLEDDTERAMVLRLTGPSFGPMVYLFEIYLPQVKITNVSFPVSGPGIISGQCEFEALVPDDDSWIDLQGVELKKHGPMIITTVNDDPWCWARDRQDSSFGSLP